MVEIVKVHIFWEGHTILRNIHSRFVLCSASQIYGGDFAKLCGLLRMYELKCVLYSHEYDLKVGITPIKRHNCYPPLRSRWSYLSYWWRVISWWIDSCQVASAFLLPIYVAYLRCTVVWIAKNPPKINFKNSWNWLVVLVPATIWWISNMQAHAMTENRNSAIALKLRWERF